MFGQHQQIYSKLVCPCGVRVGFFNPVLLELQATKFFLVEFGCCPDGETNAEGSSLEGCEDCSTSEFGCCPDQFTYATGLDGLGCDCAGKILYIYFFSPQGFSKSL